MEWGMGFKKLELVLDDFSQGFFVLHGAQIQRPLGRLDRFRKASGFGISRRQRVQNLRSIAPGKLHGLPCQFHRFLTIAQRVVWTGLSAARPDCFVIG